MSLGLVAKKCGMTRIFQEDGTSVPVSVLEVDPNRVTQVKTMDTDGYCAVQVTVGEKKVKRVNKAMAGHFAKAGSPAGMKTCEFRLTEAELNEFAAGNDQAGEGEEGGDAGTTTKAVAVDIFNAGDFVDVAGTTKGKGFAGVVKRHNFRTQDATHGNSLSHRAHGSTGQCQTPGRVFKGKKMAGQMGNKTRSTQNLEIMCVDNERNLLLVKGSVPGAAGGYVFVKPAVKKQRG